MLYTKCHLISYNDDFGYSYPGNGRVLDQRNPHRAPVCPHTHIHVINICACLACGNVRFWNRPTRFTGSRKILAAANQSFVCKLRRSRDPATAFMHTCIRLPLLQRHSKTDFGIGLSDLQCQVAWRRILREVHAAMGRPRSRWFTVFKDSGMVQSPRAQDCGGAVLASRPRNDVAPNYIRSSTLGGCPTFYADCKDTEAHRLGVEQR